MMNNPGHELKKVNSTYWDKPADDLLATFSSSLQGLDQSLAERRLQEVGPNQIESKNQVTALGLFLNQFKSPIVIILLFATILSAFVQDWTDAVIILAIVLGSALLSFVQERSAGNAAEKLKAQVDINTQVLRNGKATSIPSYKIVPGDVVSLSAGSLIPADGIVLEARDFFVNQAVLTGETYPVEKRPGPLAASASLTERTNCVFMGTNVRSGSARVLIVETGMRTAFGQIAKRLTLRPPETEFERGIRKLGFMLTEVMFVLVISIFALNVFFHKPLLDSLLFSIALAVGLTPQLLPAIININLSKGSQAMAARGVIVRRLASIENFGSMDILCTDKTGTLTLGIVSLDNALDAMGQKSSLVLRAAWLNAHFQTGMANPLDEAILSSASGLENTAVKLDEIPYDFIRKRLSVVVEENGANTLISKGALEKILEVCTHVIVDGKELPLTTEQLQNLHQRYAEWSGQGYRVLGVADKLVDSRPEYSKADEAGLAFMGFILFFDPPKPGVKEAIDRLDKLGVTLKIITGDNQLVARHTAQAIGLASPVILTGSELETLRDEALWSRVESTNIFAEVDPNEKERIILALKKMGHVVGYMGDGINDAPSLHSADVGISVANAVDVAKEAADFVLLKQDLGVLEQGIIEGRRTFANTLKYVFMATSANFGNMFSVAGASLFLPFLPMLPKQILLINFLTDLPEMTIAGDNVDDIFIQKPHRWDVGFIRRFMLIFGPLSSIFDILTFVLFMWVLRTGEAEFHTAWFIESVLSATLVVFAMRTRLRFGRSHPSRAMLWVTLGVAIIAMILPYSPFATLLGFHPLHWTYLVAIAAIVVLYFISAEFTKRWFYKTFKF
jgi:Mg2+-importing ATPase